MQYCITGRRGRSSSLRASFFPARAPLFFLPVLFSLALAGCGGGGGGSITNPGGVGSVQGAVDARQAAQAPGGAAPQSLSATVEGTSISSPVAANGSFQISSLPAGSYVIAVRNGGGPGGHPTIAGYASVQVSAGKVTAAVVTLLPAGFIAGVVSEADASGNRRPVAGVTVTLNAASQDIPPIPIYLPGPVPPVPPMPLPAQGASGGPVIDPLPPVPPSGQTPLTLTTTSAADGSFTFAGVPPGLYQVTAASNGASASDFVDVTPASAALANLFLETQPVVNNVEVHGVVLGRNADGTTHPLAGALVQMEFSFVCGSPGPIAGGGGSVGGGSVGSGSVGSGSVGSGSVGSGSVGSGTFGHGSSNRAAARSRQVAAMPPCVGPPMEPPIAAGPPNGGTSSSSGGVTEPPAPGIVPIGVKTDANGNYTLIVPSTVDGIVATADGYLPETQHLTPPLGASQELDFTLDPNPGPPSLSATLSVDGGTGDAATVTQGQPFNVKLSVTNTGSTPAVLDMFGSGAALKLVDPSGNLVWSLGFGLMMPDMDVQKVLQPGESFTVDETVPGTTNDGVPLAPGAYLLEGSLGQVTTNVVKVTVAASPAPPPPPAA